MLTAIEAMLRPHPTMLLVEIHPLPTSLLMNTELAISTTTSLPTNPTLCPMVTTVSRQNLTTTSTMIEMIQENCQDLKTLRNPKAMPQTAAISRKEKQNRGKDSNEFFKIRRAVLASS